MPHSFAKLKDGSWGLRYSGAGVGVPSSGLAVQVSKRDGSMTTVIVDAVLWRGMDRDGKTPVALCTVRSDKTPSNTTQASACRSSHQTRERRTGCSCGSVEGRIKSTDCWTCRHDAE